MAVAMQQKPVHTILLDASPILLNTPSISTLTATCTMLVTTPAVISEIKGEEARTRFETLYKPFIHVCTPKPESVKLVRDFARRTGDLAVLSGTDIEVLALAYDLECERNGGDWRLRSTPGQKRLNGKPPVKEEKEAPTQISQDATEQIRSDLKEASIEDSNQSEETAEQVPTDADEASEGQPHGATAEVKAEPVPELVEEDDDNDDDDEDNSADSDEGWITPSNIKRRQAKDEGSQNSSNQEQRTLQVATMTGDFAMQNVLLQMNLNLLSTKTCQRISHIKTTIFRCHACFQTCKDMSKQFCPRCGKPTLTRVTCTTNDRGEVKVHLKQNFQWNNRGNVYSVPKPTAGTANQKWKGPKSGGGQGGWGTDLILAEDQKEYVKAKSNQKRERQKDLMDEDTLPGILTGERKGGGRIQIGAGRNVNARKR